MLFIFREGLGHTKPPKCSQVRASAVAGHTMVRGGLSSGQSPDMALQQQDPAQPRAVTLPRQRRLSHPVHGPQAQPCSRGPSQTPPSQPAQAPQCQAGLSPGYHAQRPQPLRVTVDFCPRDTKPTHSGQGATANPGLRLPLTAETPCSVPAGPPTAPGKGRAPQLLLGASCPQGGAERWRVLAPPAGNEHGQSLDLPESSETLGHAPTEHLPPGRAASRLPRRQGARTACDQHWGPPTPHLRQACVPALCPPLLTPALSMRLGGGEVEAPRVMGSGVASMAPPAS